MYNCDINIDVNVIELLRKMDMEVVYLMSLMYLWSEIKDLSYNLIYNM